MFDHDESFAKSQTLLPWFRAARSDTAERCARRSSLARTSRVPRSPTRAFSTRRPPSRCLDAATASLRRCAASLLPPSERRRPPASRRRPSAIAFAVGYGYGRWVGGSGRVGGHLRGDWAAAPDRMKARLWPRRCARGLPIWRRPAGKTFLTTARAHLALGAGMRRECDSAREVAVARRQRDDKRRIRGYTRRYAMARRKR